MELPKAEDLRAIFAAARDNGLTRLRLVDQSGGSIEADLAPAIQSSLLDAINKSSPLPLDEDPISVVRGLVRPKASAEPQDILEAMAEGKPIVAPIMNPDPTTPQ